MKISVSGRFAVLEALYIDRGVFESLESWAAQRGLHPQDAIQLAICAFNEEERARAERTERRPTVRVREMARRG